MWERGRGGEWGVTDEFSIFSKSLGSSTEIDEEPEVTSAIEAYQRTVDPNLVTEGWGFMPAKSVEYGKTDQSLLSHVRCGVFALAQLNEVMSRLDGLTLGEADLRAVIALFVVHDVHKLEKTRDANQRERFDIPAAEVEAYVEQFGLAEFAESLTTQDFHSCAVDHHNDWTSNHATSTIRFDDLRPFVRLADAFASSETPEQATDSRIQQALDAAYPDSDVELRYHTLDDVKGVLTNLLNATVADNLEQKGYERLLLYQDGCVYVVNGEAPSWSLDEQFVDEVFVGFEKGVRNAHPAYRDPVKLAENLTTRSQGFYGINDQDFFYAGADRLLRAVALKAVDDADPDDEPTESMAETMDALEEHLSFEIERTRRPVGLARLVYTVKRTFVDPVAETADICQSSLGLVCDVFGLRDPVRDGLAAAAEDENLSLTAGGKWDYAYGAGQALLNEGLTDYDSLVEQVISGLTALNDDWISIVETDQTGNLRSELDAYLRLTVSIDGQPLPSGPETADPFNEYHTTRRAKTCTLCNRGTTSGRKEDLKTPKSLSTLQAGYSNHIPVDAGKPDKLLVCVPCQVELSLRETGSSRREAGRLFVHLVPDYFYTPLSWRAYSQFTDELSGESKTELDGLAAAILGIEDDSEDGLGTFANALISEEYGRRMVESLDQGFDPGRQFGARSLSYFKPKDNDTEFQFFGVFIGLAIGAVTGLRVVVSESPIPDVRGRDFSTFALVGGGFTQVHDFYGSEIPLTSLRSRLRAAAALVRLGYGSERDDALFAKHLRVARNQLLPGSHLLKRLAQTDDSRSAQYLLEEARILDEETGVITD
jgi:CRISPR-associated protein Csc3